MALVYPSNRTRRLTMVALAGWGSLAIAASHGCAGEATTNSGGGSGSASGSSSGSGASSGTQSSGSGTTSGTSTGSGVTSGAAGSSGTGTTSGAAGSSGTAAGTSGATGASGATAVSACVAALSPTLIDFNAFNPLSTNGFDTFFGSGTNVGYIGPFAYSGGAPDGGVDWVINPVTGRTGGLADGGMDWAMDFVVTDEAKYGASLGLWMSCVNGSTYKGITFWARGQTPIGTCSADAGSGSCFSVTLSTSATSAMTDAGAGCTGTCASPVASNLPLTLSWMQFQIPWAEFAGGLVNGASYTPTGDGIIGLQFNLSLTYPPVDGGPDAGTIYPPQAANLDFQLDDVGFMQ